MYAFGEIVLVVTGILIALQLNNWNSDRKTEHQEIDLLKEMRQNLNADLSDCRYNIRFNERLLNGSTAVLKHLEQRTPFHDTLKLHFANLFGSTVFVPNTSAYENLKSIGFSLVSNDSLRRSITKLYTERYDYTIKLELQFDSHLQLSDIGPQIYSKLVVNTLWESAYPIDDQALMKDDTFKGVIRMNTFTRNMMIRIYRDLEGRILGLMDQIDHELEIRSI